MYIYAYIISDFPFISVMEVASGEHDVDLVKAAKTMSYFRPDHLDEGDWSSNVPTIPALPGPLGKLLNQVSIGAFPSYINIIVLSKTC